MSLIALVLLWPPAQMLFRFGPHHADDVAICLGAGLATLAMLEALKPIWHSRLAS